jgi:hypothetical protein
MNTLKKNTHNKFKQLKKKKKTINKEKHKIYVAPIHLGQGYLLGYI